MIELRFVGKGGFRRSRWDEVSELLAAVARERRIVGFDVTELSPSLGPRSCAQLAAKLTYRLIGLALGPAE